MDTKTKDSIVKKMFLGELQESDVYPFPKFQTDQRDLVKEMAEATDRYFREHINFQENEKKEEIPLKVLQDLAGMGLFGMGVSEDLGGLGLTSSSYARIFMQVAGWDGAIATMLGAHQSIGYKALLNVGSDAQKKKWLPALASGEKIAAFCLTEPSSGSDAFSIKTKAISDGKGHYIINGQKIWITNAGLAEFYTVFCKTDHVSANGERKEKISCFIVEKGTPGLSFGEKEKKMGIKASETRAIFFDNVKVPESNLLGKLGDGFKIAMNVLNTGRLSLGSGCVGGMKTIIAHATSHANMRVQFGRSIKEFGMIQEKLATMTATCYSAESIVYMTTGLMEEGMQDFSLESAICKVYCSEGAWSCIDTAMQIAGGTGYMQEYPYERMMRDCRINLIFEGTNEILRCLIALLGVKAPSEDLKQLGKVTDMGRALKGPLKTLGVLGDFALKRINKMRGQKFFVPFEKEFSWELEKFGDMSRDFCLKVENTLIKYGAKVIENEFIQNRLANMAIQLYVAVSVFSRTCSKLAQKDLAHHEELFLIDLTKLCFSQAYKAFRKNYKALNKNSDQLVAKVSGHITSKGKYPLDVIYY